MKKLLGISLVAVLAATPLMASAAEGDRTVTALNAAAVAQANTQVATTSYVKGAYKATADKIDALITDTAITSNGNYIDANKTVAHNLGELDTAVKANEDAITILNGNDSTNGSVAKQIKDAISTVNSNADTLAGRVTTAEGDIDALEGRMDTAESDIDTLEATVGDASSGLVKGLADEISARADADTALDGRLDTLEGSVSTENSVLYKIDHNAAGAIYSNTTSGLTADTIQEAIDEVEGRVDTLEGKVLTVYGTWDSQYSTGTVSLYGTQQNVEPEPSETPAQPSGN